MEITPDKLAPVYLLASDHPILIERAVAQIRAAAVSPELRAFNEDVLEGRVAASQIVAAAQTLPMMGRTRLVYVRDLAAVPADQHPALVDYFAAPSPTTVLLMVTTKLDKRIKVYAQAQKRGFLHVLEAPRHAAPWIRSEAQARGVAIAPAAVERLAEAVGADLSRLALVIDQLALYAGGRPVGVEDVEDLVADTRERSVFELTDAIGAGQRTAAMAAIDSLLDQRQSGIGVITMLARHLRQLALIKAGQAEGRSKGELAQRVGAPPFVVDKLLQQARHFELTGLARGASHLAAADRALKGYLDQRPDRVTAIDGTTMRILGRQLGERVLLERLVAQLVGLAR